MVYTAAEKRLTGTCVTIILASFRSTAKQLFTASNRLVLIWQIIEYQEDLKYYWRDGYGVPINYEQACVVIDDIIQHFT